MRFKDAMQMLSDVKGLQTHRSWWVANTSIIKTLKIGRKLVLVMENDVKVPFSKTYLNNVNALNS